MGKLIALLVLAGLGFGIYWKVFHKSPAYLAYVRWENAEHEGDCRVLQAMAVGAAKEWADGFCTGGEGITVFGQSMPVPSAAHMANELAGTPAGAMQSVKREVLSEEGLEDGSVNLAVVETYGGGRPSNFNKPAPPRRIDMKLKREGDSWQVLEVKQQDQPQ